MGDLRGARLGGRTAVGGLGICGNFWGTDVGRLVLTFLGDGLLGTLTGL